MPTSEPAASPRGPLPPRRPGCASWRGRWQAELRRQLRRLAALASSTRQTAERYDEGARMRLYDRDGMAVRKGARFMAPLALAATVAACYLVVHSQLETHKSTPATHSHSGATLIIHTHKSTGHSHGPVFYVIRPGDTLSGIAARTHVPLSTLTALNPGLNPSALHVGRRLRLRG